MIQEKQRVSYQTPEALRPDRQEISHPLLRMCLGLITAFATVLLWWNASVLFALACQANTERFKWYQIRDAIPCFLGGCLTGYIAYRILRCFAFEKD